MQCNCSSFEATKPTYVLLLMGGDVPSQESWQAKSQECKCTPNSKQVKCILSHIILGLG